MKKNKRIKLLIAGTAVLSASILIPSVLAACASVSENKPSENDNNNKPPVEPEKPKPDPQPQPEPEPEPLPPTVPGIANKIKILNQSGNSASREFIYRDFIKDLNTPAPAPAPETPNSRSKAGDTKAPNSAFKDALNKIETSGVTKFNPTTRFDQLKTNERFIRQLLDMIIDGLKVGNGINEINESDYKALVDHFKPGGQHNAALLTAMMGTDQNNSNGYSNWSANAFAFEDDYGLGSSSTPIATWTFKNHAINDTNTTKLKVEYSLYLTSDVEFSYAWSNDTASVTVVNKGSSSSQPVRFEVKTTANGQTTTNVYHFKTEDHNNAAVRYGFKLPSLLLDQFSDYFKLYDQNASKYQKYWDAGSNVYKQYASGDNQNSEISAMSLWNQFTMTYNEQIGKSIKEDLISKKSDPNKSLLIKWLRENIGGTTVYNTTGDTGSQNTNDPSVIDDLVNDLKNTNKDVDVWLSPLTIKGTEVQRGTEPTVGIYFKDKASSGSKVSAGTPASENVVYFLDLYATGFKFQPYSNENLGFDDKSMRTTPELKLGDKSVFASYAYNKPASSPDVVGNPSVDASNFTKKKSASIKNANQFVDVSYIYDMNVADFGFTYYLGDLLKKNDSNKNTEVTNNLISESQGNDSRNLINNFTKYLYSKNGNIVDTVIKTTQGKAIADLIFDNIDFNNMALHTNISVGYYDDKMPKTNQIQLWKQKVAEWVNDKSKCELTFSNLDGSPDSYGSIRLRATKYSGLLKLEDINGTTSTDQIKKNNNWFSSIYITLGKPNSISSVIPNSVLTKGSKAESISSSSKLSIAAPTKEVNDGESVPVNGSNTIENMGSRVKDRIAVSFQKTDNHDKGSTTPKPEDLMKWEGPIFTYYMGQEKNGASNGLNTPVPQKSFPIIIPKAIISDNSFVESMATVTINKPTTDNKPQSVLSAISMPAIVKTSSSWLIKR